jgi:hypothetical protein
MNFRTPFLPLTIALAVSTLVAAEPKPNTLSTAEKSAGWKLLFDGKSLDGWRGYKAEKIGDGWAVQDGAITLTKEKGAGDLMTKEDFGDFELAFDWKITETGNSGVIYRVGLGDNAPYRTGPEYQVLDNIKATDNKKPNHLAGSLYDIGAAPGADWVKPVGEWNTGKIVVRGWKVEHWLNGKKVIAIDLASAEGKAAIAESKFKTWPKFASLARGHIALQDHGHVVSFRSIKVRELK